MVTWDLLQIVAIGLVVLFFFKGKSALWGSLTLGIATALAVGVFYLLKGDGFSWFLFKKIIIISIYVGALFEIYSILFSPKKRTDDRSIVQ